MIGLFDWLKIGTGAVMGAMLCYPVAHYLGEREGRQEAATAALEKTVEAYKSREETDSRVENLDTVAICVELGVPIERCEAEFRAVAGD